MLGDEMKLESGDMFHYFDLDELIPENHLLRRIDAVLDTSWVRSEVAECYSNRGRPSWDPEVIVRMVLLGYLYDLSDVRLVDDLRMHLGYRWFCRLQPSDPVPNRTTLVKLRNDKWSGDLWEKLFIKTVHQCQEEGIISGKHVSIDGTKIKANAAWGSLEPIEPATSIESYLEDRLGWNEPPQSDDKPDEPNDDDPTPRGGVNFRGKSLKNEEYRSTTDPDALIYRKDDGEGACLAYIGNFCIDTKSRVVLAAEASRGRTSGEWTAGASMLDFVERVLGRKPRIVTADRGYGVTPFYFEVDRRGIVPHIPPRNSCQETRIPGSRLLAMAVVPFHRAKDLIFKRRGIRARNKALRKRSTISFRISRLLRLRVEHKIGEAKECHGMRRARHRGLEKVDRQVKTTAAVMNLKQLARLAGRGPIVQAARNRRLLAFLSAAFGTLMRVLTRFHFPGGFKAQLRHPIFATFSQGF